MSYIPFFIMIGLSNGDNNKGPKRWGIWIKNGKKNNVFFSFTVLILQDFNNRINGASSAAASAGIGSIGGKKQKHTKRITD